MSDALPYLMLLGILVFAIGLRLHELRVKRVNTYNLLVIRHGEKIWIRRRDLEPSDRKIRKRVYRPFWKASSRGERISLTD